MKRGVGTIQSRQLGRHLRDLRKECGLRAEEVAEELGVSHATVYRVESGESVPRAPDVKAWCELCGAEPGVTAALVALSKEADSPGWWRSYSGAIPRWFDMFMSMESSARTIRAYESEIIFGLLQTRPYAEAVIGVDPLGVSGEEQRQRATVRVERQRILARRNPPELDLMLNEAALIRSPGPGLMVEQLGHIDSMSRKANVTVRIIPQGILHGGVNCGTRFTLLDFPAERRGMAPPPVVFADNLTGAAYLDKPAEIEAYESVWEAMLKVALTPSDSRKLVQEHIRRYHDEMAQV